MLSLTNCLVAKPFIKPALAANSGACRANSNRCFNALIASLCCVPTYSCAIQRPIPSMKRDERLNRGASHLLDFPEEPRAGKRPCPFHRAERKTQFFGSLLLRQAHKKAKVNNSTGSGIHCREPLPPFRQGKQSFIRNRGFQSNPVYVNPMQLPTTFQPLFAPRILNHNPAHGFPGCGEEMGSVFPPTIIATEDSEPCFIDKPGWLKSMTGCLPRHPRASQLPQFSIEYGD